MINTPKTEIKNYNHKVFTNFEDNNIPKDNEYCSYLYVILLDFIFANLSKQYHPQIFLGECKYAIKDR